MILKRELRLVVGIQSKVIHTVHCGLELHEELVPLFRKNVVFRTGKEQRNIILFHCVESVQHSVKDLADFPQRRLLVVERIQQSEDHSNAGIFAGEKLRQPAGNSGFHLVAGKTARDEDPVQQCIGIETPLASEVGDSVHVEPVAPVNDGD